MKPALRALLASALALALALALAAPASASASRDVLPIVDASDGVTVERHDGGYRARFARRAAPLYRKLARRTVRFECSRSGRGGPGGVIRSDMSETETVRAPAARATLATGITLTRADVCVLSVRHDDGFACEEGWCPIAIVPLTEAGRVRVTELERATEISLVLLGVVLQTKERWPAFARVAGELDADLVELPAPDAAPAQPGRIGYWTDGASLALATLGRDGRRLFVRIEGDAISTNLPDLFDGGAGL